MPNKTLENIVEHFKLASPFYLFGTVSLGLSLKEINAVLNAQSYNNYSLAINSITAVYWGYFLIRDYKKTYTT